MAILRDNWIVIAIGVAVIAALAVGWGISGDYAAFAVCGRRAGVWALW